MSAAIDAFARDGYGATSMASLARTAGISKTTLYSKFASKSILFGAIIDKQAKDAFALLGETETVTLQKNLALSLENMANRMLAAALAPDVLKITRLIEWESGRFPELAIAAQTRSRIGIDIMTKYISSFSKLDNIPCRDPERAAKVMNFAVRGLYHALILQGPSVRPNARRTGVKDIVRIFMASRSTW